MGISFKTTESKAVIFYQAHLDSTTTYFKAVIQGEKEVSFEYSFMGKANRITLNADSCLNCGKWQHIWIERNEYQMRYFFFFIILFIIKWLVFSILKKGLNQSKFSYNVPGQK